MVADDANVISTTSARVDCTYGGACVHASPNNFYLPIALMNGNHAYTYHLITPLYPMIASTFPFSCPLIF